MSSAARTPRRHRIRLAAIVAVVAALATPETTTALPGQDPAQTEEERAEVRERKGEVDLEVDALEAEHGELTAALATLAENVSAQEAAVEEAERAAQAAEDDLADAEDAVDDAEDRITDLEETADDLVVDAYVNPPSDTMFAAITAENISDAAIKQVVLDMQGNATADLFDQLTEAHQDLELERANKEVIAAEAETKRTEAETALTGLQEAQTQQQEFAADVEDALEQKLAEAATLAERDRELSEQIAAEQAELARQLEAARQAEERRRQEAASQAASAAASPAPAPSSPSQAAPPAPSGPGTISPAPGGLATVSCPRGGAITVAGSLSHNLRALLDAAGAAGVGLCGWGYRDPQRQIELRRSHCGSSDYAVWHMPASRCSPPTARPGRSMHERGLAVDFTCDGGSIGTRGSHCFRWLAANAASYGLYNLPSEPWHWSTTGG